MKGLELDDSKKCCWSNIAIDILARAPEKQQVIESVAPYRRKFPWRWYYYQPVNPSLKTSLQNAAAWDPSQYDGDASLWALGQGETVRQDEFFKFLCERPRGSCHPSPMQVPFFFQLEESMWSKKER